MPGTFQLPRKVGQDSYIGHEGNMIEVAKYDNQVD